MSHDKTKLFVKEYSDINLIETEIFVIEENEELRNKQKKEREKKNVRETRNEISKYLSSEIQ